jgi:hypothetical protein
MDLRGQPFHTMGFDKYKRLNVTNRYENIEGATINSVRLLNTHLRNLMSRRTSE